MKPAKFYKSFLKHSAVYTFGGILQRGMAIFLFPIYTSYLVPEEYGVIGILSVTQSLLVPVCILGVSTSLMIEYYHSNHEAERKIIVVSAFVLGAGLSILSSFLVFLNSERISIALFSTEKLKYLVSLSSITLCTDGISAIGFSFLRVSNRSIRYISVSIISAIFAGLLNILFIVYLGRGLEGFYEASVIVGGIQALVLSAWIVLFAKGHRIEYNSTKKLIKFGLPELPLRIVNWVLFSNSRYFLLYLGAINEVGIYSIAFRIATIMELLFVSLSRKALEPFLLSMMNDDNSKSIYGNLFTYMVIIGVFLVIFIASISESILMIFANNPSFWPAHLSIKYLLVGFFFYGIYMLLRPILLIIKRPSKAIPVVFVSTVVNILLNCIFIPIVGSEGAAISLMMSMIIMAIYMYYITHKEYKVPISLLKNIRIVLAGIVVYILVNIIPSYSPSTNLFLQSTTVIIAFPLSLLLVNTFEDYEKDILCSWFKKYQGLLSKHT